MFNWTYFILYTLAGMFTAAISEPNVKHPSQCPLWTWNLAPFAGLATLALLLAIVYTGFTFGIAWAFVSFGEVALGAVLWGLLRVGK